MEDSSDSSCDSVVFLGPTPEYAERLNKKSTLNSETRNPDENSILESKVGKIQELEDLVNATGSFPLGVENRGDEDAGTWSESDTKSTKECRTKSSSSKYLKKIKTLQQNKRRQETRISRLTKEVRGLRDKNSVQAAYIDVLCGMLGEDMVDKFKDRQGHGILGNLKAYDDDVMSKEQHEDSNWELEDDNDGDHNIEDNVEEERKFYCVENLEETTSIVNDMKVENAQSSDVIPGIEFEETKPEVGANQVHNEGSIQDALVQNGISPGEGSPDLPVLSVNCNKDLDLMSDFCVGPEPSNRLDPQLTMC